MSIENDVEFPNFFTAMKDDDCRQCLTIHVIPVVFMSFFLLLFLPLPLLFLCTFLIGVNACYFHYLSLKALHENDMLMSQIYDMFWLSPSIFICCFVLAHYLVGS